MDMTVLRRQHEEIGETADLLAQAITATQRPEGVARLRWQLARQLMAHLALEDRILYPALRQSTDPATREQAILLHKATGNLADSFACYLATWSDDRVAREWPTFCVETRTILAVLYDRIERENRILYPLADTGISPPSRLPRRA